MAPEKIVEGLKKLDVSNAGHWTTTGTPALAVLAVFAGGKVTAAELEEAAPGFNRESAPTYFLPKETEAKAPEPVNEPVKEDQALKQLEEAKKDNVDGVGDQPATKPDEAKDVATTKDLADAYVDNVKADLEKSDEKKEQLERLDHELQRLHESRDELNRVIAELNKQRDEIVSAMAVQAEASKGTETVEYLKGQQRLRDAKAARLKELQEAGVTAKMLKDLIPQRSKLDQALASNRRK